MSDEPTCPECNTIVLPDWDWCHGCGFDPDGHRASSQPATAFAAAPGTPATGGVPAGWYADPGGQPLVRYWDGAGWTAHVRDLAPPAPPAPAAAAPADRPPAPVDGGGPTPPEAVDVSGTGTLLDVEISQPGLTKKRLVVTRDGMVLGKTAVEFSQVMGYTFWVIKTKVNGISAGTDRRVVLVTPQGKEKVVFGEGGIQRKATKLGQADAFDRFVAICGQVVGDRLCREGLELVRAGRPLTVAKFDLDRDGFTVGGLTGRKQYRWSQYAGARLNNGEAQVFVDGGAKPKKAAGVSMKEINSVLLPALMDQCARELGR